jgi:DNA polymerase zeta
LTPAQAIRLIDATRKWGGKVVYGDTDSLFVYLPGKTKDQAFRIGHDIADSVTALNPVPIKLRFDKVLYSLLIPTHRFIDLQVYLPCVLMAKKRYVGFKYESADIKEPTFDAKGIETVRRDGVPAQHKMVEKCLTFGPLPTPRTDTDMQSCQDTLSNTRSQPSESILLDIMVKNS